MFGIQKTPIYGTYGEFTVGSSSSSVRAKFLLTKMKPGSEGIWENTLASKMVPWREVFDAEDLTFDELLQRDLDDSRVAHDLIPYLLGESGNFAKFFPPILAVLVPQKKERDGILPYYPQSVPTGKYSESFGDLFDFRCMEFPDADGNSTVSPLGEIKYNQQKAAFIIVDGQHRAMAVLALHRQINKEWGTDSSASFYNHLTVDESQVGRIELPICVIFFPDLHEGSAEFIRQGIDLKAVCREIFLVVNKNAKPVSQSRELLLDDEDIAARMMRDTLSKLKGRGENNSSLARIYSFAFGDSVSGEQHRKTEVVAGQLEFTTAVALHKMHCASAFGVPDAFNLDGSADITDGRRTQNPVRPVSILLGTKLQKWPKLSRLSGKYHEPSDVKLASALLARMTDDVILPLFDEFHPFVLHNQTIRALRTRLLDPDLQSDPIQKKCYSLLFEGSGVRSVFEEHIKRLNEREQSYEEEGLELSDYINNQLSDAKATAAALEKYEDRIKGQRAAKFFQINYDILSSSEDNKSLQQEVNRAAKSIFDTVSTQAFQLGYLMLVHSVAELLLEPADEYETRMEIIKFISKIYIGGMNSYFSEASDVEHRSLIGFIKEPRCKVFAPNQLGLRGLLSLSVKELNERQWKFFRYAILEIVHSKYSCNSLNQALDSEGSEKLSKLYREALPSILDSLLKLRNEYIDQAVSSRKNSSEFKQEVQVLEATLRAEGKNEEEVDSLVQKKATNDEQSIRMKCKEHLQASLGEVLDTPTILNRFSA